MKKGYTLIELLVVLGIFTVLATLLTTSLFSILKTNTKTKLMKEIRQNGSYVMDVMIKEIVGGTISADNCQSGSDSLTILNSNGSEITFSCSDEKIASDSASLIDISRMKVADCSNVFSCEMAGSNKKVTIDFVLKQKGDISRPEEEAQQGFRKIIIVRNE
mgnify:CR=1 FL=1